MKKKKLIIIIISLILLPTTVFAHSGRTDSKGCHTCRTNCHKYGLSYGEYHCHNGGYEEEKESNVKTIKSIYIDGETIKFKNNMTIKTDKDSPYIYIHPTDTKATTTTNQKDKLSYGNNKITITVTAENGTKKKYYLNVYVSNNDMSLKSIKVDNNNVKLDENMIYTTKNLNPKIDITPNSSKSKVEIVKPEKFDIGDNYVIIKVKSERGNIQRYNLNIHIMSDDVTLKYLKIGRKLILDVSNEIEYYTDSDKVTIVPFPTNEYANVIVKKEYPLEIGTNEIPIKVISEDKTKQKTYIIKVIREENKSDNTDIRLYLNGSKINFYDYKTNEIKIGYDNKDLDLDYVLGDSKSTTNLNTIKNLKPGQNIVNFQVVSENGKVQDYQLNIYRKSKLEEMLPKVILFGLIEVIMVGMYFKKTH